MSLESHKSVNDAEALRSFLEDFETINEYFHITDGTISRGKAEMVKITNYHAVLEDLLDNDKRQEHVLSSIDADGVWIPLVIKREIRPHFRIGDYRLRFGHQSHLISDDRNIPVRLIMIDNIDEKSSRIISTNYWIYRYTQDIE
jgi:hypothetical protein